jgi:bud site selection protein 31
VQVIQFCLLHVFVISCTLSYFKSILSAEINEPHEGLRKTESQWPVHQINWQKSRYIYDMYYVHHKISRIVYDYCIKNKLVDAALIAKWKKPGYERLCSTYVINPRNYKFGTVSICRVPTHCLADGTEIEDATTGCRGCASGSGNSGNIFGNKYGQYLAAIQIAREERERLKEENSDDEEDEDDDEEEETNKGESKKRKPEEPEEYLGPVGAADGSSGVSSSQQRSVWADSAEEQQQQAAAAAGLGGGGGGVDSSKKQRRA